MRWPPSTLHLVLNTSVLSEDIEMKYSHQGFFHFLSVYVHL